MKALLTIAALVAFLDGGGAMAQSVIDMPPHRPSPRDAAGDMPDGRPDRRGREPKQEWRMEHQADAEGGGARFHIDDGQTKIDLNCPAGEPVRECADVLLLVIDRMQAKSVPSERDGGDADRYRQRTE